jgi:hypothetical protein
LRGTRRFEPAAPWCRGRWPRNSIAKRRGSGDCVIG